jgi:hypothetical protein
MQSIDLPCRWGRAVTLSYVRRRNAAVGCITRCLLTTLLLTASARSAEIFYMDHDLLMDKYVGPVGPLVISGDIDPGDYQRFVARIESDENRFLSQNRIIVASNGGDVSEAMKIALLIQSMYSEVTVEPQTGRCLGACFLIYAAADRRATGGERLIGLHRPTLIDAVSAALSPADAAALEDRALAQVRAFLVANEVPEYLMEEMFHRSSNEVYWLSPQDEQTLGFKSSAFLQYLKTHCAWDAALEKDVYAGKRPFADLAEATTCRDRATLADARKALAAARKDLWPHTAPPPKSKH